MADKPQSWPVVVDGRGLVAVSGEDFDRLLAIRRQVGGQSSRIRVLMAAMGDLLETLKEIETALGEVAATHDCRGPACTLCAAVADLPERIRAARRAAQGRGRSAPEDSTS